MDRRSSGERPIDADGLWVERETVHRDMRRRSRQDEKQNGGLGASMRPGVTTRDSVRISGRCKWGFSQSSTRVEVGGIYRVQDSRQWGSNLGASALSLAVQKRTSRRS